MNKVIFPRRNKTVRGNIQAKGVLKMLEQDRRTWMSAQEMVYITQSYFGVFDGAFRICRLTLIYLILSTVAPRSQN